MAKYSFTTTKKQVVNAPLQVKALSIFEDKKRLTKKILKIKNTFILIITL